MKVFGISIDRNRLTLTHDHIIELETAGLAVGLTSQQDRYVIYNKSKPLPVLKSDTVRLKNMLSRVRSDDIYNSYNDVLKIEDITQINEYTEDRSRK